MHVLGGFFQAIKLTGIGEEGGGDIKGEVLRVLCLRAMIRKRKRYFDGW
jgi:hypothetical protein